MTKDIFSERTYLDVKLIFEKPRVLDAREFKTCLLHALRTLFGASGAAMEAHVIRHDGVRGAGVVCVWTSEAEKVRSALTLVGEVDGQPCRFEVCQESTCLLGLASNSDNFLQVLVQKLMPDTI